MERRKRRAVTVSIAAVLSMGSATAASAAQAAPAFGTTTMRVSVSSAEFQGFGVSSQSEMSADGRYVAFVSGSRTLAPGDTNGQPDVYLRDRVAGTTTRVSVSSSGDQGNGRSDGPSISRDGRFVAFFSYASTLVSGDTNGKPDVFLRDVVAGTTRRVSVSSGGQQGNGDSSFASVSDDGRLVAFQSVASNLVNGDGNGVYDVFVRDLSAGTTRRVSVSSGGAGGNGHSLGPAISGNGDVVGFLSDASNLVTGDVNAHADVFVRVRSAGVTQLVSVGTGGQQSDNLNQEPALSRDGRYVTFSSAADNLVPGDANGFQDVFLRDRTAGTTELVSAWPSGTPTNRLSFAPDISDTGQIIVFESLPSEAGSVAQVYRWNRAHRASQLASVGTGGAPADSGTSGSSVSPDGLVVGFTSAATNLVAGDTNNQQDVFVRR
jgi:Tol biopolymer transport system component